MGVKLILQWAKKVFSISVDLCVPTLLFASGIFFYCEKGSSYTNEPYIFHLSFYAILMCLALLFYFIKNSKESVLVLFVFFSYTLMNVLKKYNGIDFFNVDYCFLSMLIPFNWLLYLMSDFFKLPKQYDFYFLCIILIEAMIIENKTLLGISEFSMLVKFAILCVWGVSILAYMVYISIFPSMKQYGLFFVYLSLGLSLINYDSVFAVSIYYSFSLLIVLVSMIYTVVYAYFRDTVTGVYGINTYLRQSKEFPLKYSLGVICIDDYAKLLKVFGRRQLNLLLKMLIGKVKESSMGAEIYRYNEDEFVLIFYNEDKKKSFEYLENIRRSIASSEFVINSKQSVRMTISSGVSEKKRSDADADAVLLRAREAFQKTYKFTQNVTSMA